MWINSSAGQKLKEISKINKNVKSREIGIFYIQKNMSSILKNLSNYNPDLVPDGSSYKIGIAVSEWNHEVTGALLNGAVEVLKKHHVQENNIEIVYVPGSFELPKAAKFLAETANPDAVICIGCVIQGETRHFDFICQGVTIGIMNLNIQYEIPFIFGVLTTENQTQALERAGGKHGNKGTEAGITALKMVRFKK